MRSIRRGKWLIGVGAMTVIIGLTTISLNRHNDPPAPAREDEWIYYQVNGLEDSIYKIDQRGENEIKVVSAPEIGSWVVAGDQVFLLLFYMIPI